MFQRSARIKWLSKATKSATLIHNGFTFNKLSQRVFAGKCRNDNQVSNTPKATNTKMRSASAVFFFKAAGYLRRFVAVSGNTTMGLKVLASSGVMDA